MLWKDPSYEKSSIKCYW